MDIERCSSHGSQSKLRIRRGLNGIFVQRQCNACLDGIGESVELAAFAKGNSFPYWLTEKKPNSKKRDYSAHLKSKFWHALKLVVFERDGYLCMACKRAGVETEATALGHKHYRTFGHEQPEDVEASCNDCEQAERQQRISGFKGRG